MNSQHQLIPAKFGHINILSYIEEGLTVLSASLRSYEQLMVAGGGEVIFPSGIANGTSWPLFK